ncbi:hypothetical protein C8J36_10368 [Rhizobium sp. PP-F2F-G48]|uniref:hypothetical protein n=1 Tax=Rhizobium sp. PP-F2F-G48 TaxID=2135651 RepID=UPI001042D967|nr:hypothetical protein [Rhizobium sp. PP-F2F-G48]TCM55704.1 hypothetical protein C8J36_10368 [Rhizobium sp. PP-F2F-G48]
MKIADSPITPYRTPLNRPSAGFDPSQIDAAFSGGQPGAMNRDAAGGAGRSGAGDDIAAVIATDPTVSLSAAFWAINAEKRTARAEDDRKAVQAVADRAADKAETRNAFLDWAGKSLAETIRAQVLEKHGQTEGSLAQMDPEARKAIEQEIADAIKRQAGLDVDETSALAQVALPAQSQAAAIPVTRPDRAD